jgi:hypothetical protein
MRIFVTVLLTLFPFFLKAQLHQWMPNMPLTDSSHNNRNACLFQQYPDRIIFFDQQTDATTTQLCYRSISPGIGDVTIALSQAGAKFTNPKVLELNFFPSPTKVLYQTNEGGDIDLKYFTFSNWTVSAPGILADLPGDDINLATGPSGIVAWENSGKIWVSQYFPESDSFSAPFAVDSAGSYSPAFSGKLNYLKSYGDSTMVISSYISYNQGNWQISDIVTKAFAGMNSSLVSTAPFYWNNSMCMENEIGTNPTGLILFDEQYSQTQFINSIMYNYTEPAIYVYKIGVKSDLYFLSYVSDSLVQNEIFTETPFSYPGTQNISLWPGDDRNPEFFESYGEDETIRVYLFWESEHQGFSTIYSTYLEYPFGGTDWIPKAESLVVNPCPFKHETTITLESAVKTQFRIMDLQGREIKSLIPQKIEYGWQKAIWDGTDHHGNSVPSGSYVIVVRSGSATQSRIIIKK